MYCARIYFLQKKAAGAKAPAGQAVFFHKAGPGTAWGLRKPRKGILPASGGTECSAFCITCPACRKQASSRCVLHLLEIEHHPAALETDSESLFTLPGTAGGCRFAKASHNHRAGGLRWPYKGLLPACASRRTEFYSARITCPTACKRAISVLTAVFCS